MQPRLRAWNITQALRAIAEVESDTSAAAPPDADEELRTDYLLGRYLDVARIRHALRHGDFTRLRNLGRSLRASGTPYGFPAITRLGAELEDAALHADRTCVTDLASLLERLLAAHGD